MNFTREERIEDQLEALKNLFGLSRYDKVKDIYIFTGIGGNKQYYKPNKDGYLIVTNKNGL